MSIPLIPLLAALASKAPNRTTLLITSRLLRSELLLPTSFRPQASYRLNSSGVAQSALGSTQNALVYSDITGQWITGTFNTADYEGRLTIDSTSGVAGTMTGSTVGSFLQLNSIRTWTWTKDSTSAGTSVAVCTVRVQEIANTSNFSEATITFECVIDV